MTDQTALVVALVAALAGLGGAGLGALDRGARDPARCRHRPRGPRLIVKRHGALGSAIGS